MALVKISGQASAAPALGTMMFPIETAGGAPGRLNLSDLYALIGFENSVTAFATGGQTSATALSTAAKIHRISVCATDGDSVKLQLSVSNDWHIVINDGAKILQLFGTSPDTVDSVATGTGVPIGPGCRAMVSCSFGGNWTTLIGLSNAMIAQICYLNLANTFTKAQRVTPVKFTDASTITLDLSLSNIHWGVLGGNRTFGVPTNVVEGQAGFINSQQDSTGTRTGSWAWIWKWPGGVAGTLSTVAGTQDQVPYSVDRYNSGTFTVTLASPGVITWTAHGRVAGEQCQLSTTGTLPTGYTAATTYWLIFVDANTVRLATTLANAMAGTAINTSGSQSGVHTIISGSIKVAMNKAYP